MIHDLSPIHQCIYYIMMVMYRFIMSVLSTNVLQIFNLINWFKCYYVVILKNYIFRHVWNFIIPLLYP